ncbi:MAG: hypothetical protein ACRC50_02590, partial [Gaiella sp.]
GGDERERLRLVADRAVTCAHVAFALGGALVDLETGAVELVEERPAAKVAVDTGLPLVVAAAALGSRIVAVVERRPPLLVSDDAGSTWREVGGGLPPGVDVAFGNSPDEILYASAKRLHVSRNGGLFWAAVDVELDGLLRVAWADAA